MISVPSGTLTSKVDDLRRGLTLSLRKMNSCRLPAQSSVTSLSISQVPASSSSRMCVKSLSCLGTSLSWTADFAAGRELGRLDEVIIFEPRPARQQREHGRVLLLGRQGVAEQLVVFGDIVPDPALFEDEDLRLRLVIFPAHPVGLLEIELPRLLERRGDDGRGMLLLELGFERPEGGEGGFELPDGLLRGHRGGNRRPGRKRRQERAGDKDPYFLEQNSLAGIIFQKNRTLKLP